jgi:hypothetical protein
MVVGKLVVRQGICESRFSLKPGASIASTIEHQSILNYLHMCTVADPDMLSRQSSCEVSPITRNTGSLRKYIRHFGKRNIYSYPTQKH